MDNAFKNLAEDLDLFSETETYILIHYDDETGEVSMKLGFKDGKNEMLKTLGLVEAAKSLLIGDL